MGAGRPTGTGTDPKVLALRGSRKYIREKRRVKPEPEVVEQQTVSRFWAEGTRSRRDDARLKRPRKGNGVDAKWRKLFQLIPGYDPEATAGKGDWFSKELAQDSVEFFESEQVLIEGERAGKPFKLEPWQQAVTGCLFGWLQPNGLRRYRESLVYVPRKNGKTPWAAGMVNLVMFQDHEPGAQIYSAAADLAQASLLYRHTAGMMLRNPEMDGRVRIYRSLKSIEYEEEGSLYKSLTSDADTKHGLGAHFVIVDELHAHPSGDLVDVLTTSTAARREPIVLYITTADFQRESVCNQKYDYACKVRDQVLSDPSFLPVIYESSVDDDWTDPKVWAKANPNLGVSVKRDYLERQCERAKNEPTYENTFKRLHLNIRTQQDVRWVGLEKWQACAEAVDEEALLGRTCYAGLDLSTKVDLTSYVLAFPPTEDDPKWRVLPRFFAPRENAIEREKKDRVPYVTWSDQGFLYLTEGNVVDYDRVGRELLAEARKFDLREIAYDPWGATQLALQLQAEGATVVEFRQGFGSMSEPTKELERLIMSKALAHGGNPILSWMFSHVSVEEDGAGNIKLSKKKSRDKIDGLVALVMAIGRAVVAPTDTQDLYFFGGGGRR